MCPEHPTFRDRFHKLGAAPFHHTAVYAVGALLAAGGMLLAGCALGASPSGTGLATVVSPSERAPAGTTGSVPTAATAEPAPPERRVLPGGLVLESYPLTAPPTLDPLTFQPLEGTQAEVLARHAAERQQAYVLDLQSDDQYRPTLTAAWEGGPLLARIDTDPSTQSQTAELWHGDQRLFSAPAGFPSPASALQGLWTYDGHWAMELLMATPDEWIGQVYVDGVLLNDQLGDDEVFGFQLLDGRAFTFFKRAGTIGVRYDGQSVDLGYAQIPHYECCSGSALNPVKAPSMVAFFAEAGRQWRYVEIGAFGDN
jgi:hypothetical protein